MIDVRSVLATLAAIAHRAPRHAEDRRLLAAGLLAYPAWQVVVRSARAVDHLVAPGHRDRPVRAPVFLVGHPRSGTTLLHRLLALDPRFTVPLGWELALPAVVLHRAVRTLARARIGVAAAAALEARLFSGMQATHTTGWSAVEEDDWLFAHACATPTVEFVSGRPAITRHYWLGDTLPMPERRRALDWHRRSVQRFLHARPTDAVWLSKNPHFTGWIRALDEAYPDARFVMVVRDPADAIASRLAMAAAAWARAGGAPGRTDDRYRELFLASCAVYRHAEAVWPTLPEARGVRLRYDDLVADPEAAVRSVYAHFAWQPTAAVEARWAAAAATARRRVPSQRPTLRQFGIRRGDLAAELADVASLWEVLRRPAPRGHR